METGSTSSLDSLASNGIINFDANAFLKGTTPRYVGSPSPELYLPGDQPLMNSPFVNYGIRGGNNLSGVPSRDAFVVNEGAEGSHSKKQMPWNKIVTGGLVGALGLFIYSKVKGVKLPEGVTKAYEACKNKISSVVEKVKPAKVKEVAEKAAEEVKNKKGVPTWVKVAGLGIAGVLGLYEIYKVKTSHKAQAPQE